MKFTAVIDNFVYGLIILSTVAIIIESDPDLGSQYASFFAIFELVTILLFTIEYVYRTILNYLLTKGFKYNFSLFGLIDLIAILPFYLPFAFVFDSRSLRMLRLFRALRIMKLSQHSQAIRNLAEVFNRVRSELALTLLLSAILITFCGIIIFYAENPAQPESFNNMGNSIWWALETLTTVGYGDIAPVTPFGKVIASFVAVIGIGLIAIPTGLISATYIELLREHKRGE
ncbi:MAG: ion transporter [Saprospiraceae bacterium]